MHITANCKSQYLVAKYTISAINILWSAYLPPGIHMRAFPLIIIKVSYQLLFHIYIIFILSVLETIVKCPPKTILHSTVQSCNGACEKSLALILVLNLYFIVYKVVPFATNLKLKVCVCVCVCAVSYTHLTLPTRRTV